MTHMEDNKRRLVEYVRLKREAQDLSIRKLAEITGVSFATLSRLERGQGLPDDNTIARLANWLGEDATQFDLPITQVAEVHFRAGKNADARTIEALSNIAELLKARHAKRK